ncbi:helix-turn-helix transcriptional regulator [Streptomyces sp. NPDC092296]|uniref:helix-turn-helix domain-containing protein n=1 Tax=Streptomyces sp. NPDC092296 TaxID=3366012 RepID=UPI0038144047
MPANLNPTVRQRRLGRRLRQLRSMAGMTHAEIAEVLECGEAKIARIEKGHSGIRIAELRLMLDAYRVTDHTTREQIESLSRESRQRGWWARYPSLAPTYADYIELETEASDIYTVETSLIPGLLQTPAYREAVIRLHGPDATDAWVEAQVKVHDERRQLLARETPPRLWLIMMESVLNHEVGGPEVMREQLASLAGASSATNVELQILPAESALNACLFGPFGIMAFPAAAETDIVYMDSLLSTVYLEDAEEVQKYTTLFRRLNAESLSVKQSSLRIQQALERMVTR